MVSAKSRARPTDALVLQSRICNVAWQGSSSELWLVDVAFCRRCLEALVTSISGLVHCDIRAVQSMRAAHGGEVTAGRSSRARQHKPI